MKKFIFSMVLSGALTSSFATVTDEMNEFFKNSGFMSNTTKADVWQNQAAGYVGGGSLYARNAVRNYQLIRLDLPTYRAGCGGIDLYTGAFSFISADRMVEMGKQIMTNGGAYAVDLMLSTTVPELLNVKNYLQDVMTKVNSTNINSCNAAQSLVGGIWPKIAASQKKICQDIKTTGNTGVVTDFAQAQQDCEDLDKLKDSLKEAKKDKQYEKQIVINKNIIWDAIQSQPFIAKDNELAEFIMNITGTIIFDGNGNPTILPSMADSQQLVKAFIGDGVSDVKIPIKKCSTQDKSCLLLIDGEIEITKDNSLSSRVETIIEGINEKLHGNQNGSGEIDWTEDEKRFVSMISMPILKGINVMGSMKFGLTSSDLYEYSGEFNDEVQLGLI